jgi:hypothetical protein
MSSYTVRHTKRYGFNLKIKKRYGYSTYVFTAKKTAGYPKFPIGPPQNLPNCTRVWPTQAILLRTGIFLFKQTETANPFFFPA